MHNDKLKVRVYCSISYGDLTFVNRICWGHSVNLIKASITLWQWSLNPLPVSKARLLAPEDSVLSIHTKHFSLTSCYVLQFTRNMSPWSTSIYRSCKCIIRRVHTVDVSVAAINLFESSIDTYPWSCAWLLALEDLVIWVDTPDVAVSWSRDMLQSARYQSPTTTSINWAFPDLISWVHPPDLLVTCINLLETSCNMDPIATSARFHTSVDWIALLTPHT